MVRKGVTAALLLAIAGVVHAEEFCRCVGRCKSRGDPHLRRFDGAEIKLEDEGQIGEWETMYTANGFALDFTMERQNKGTYTTQVKIGNNVYTAENDCQKEDQIIGPFTQRLGPFGSSVLDQYAQVEIKCMRPTKNTRCPDSNRRNCKFHFDVFLTKTNEIAIGEEIRAADFNEIESYVQADGFCTTSPDVDVVRRRPAEWECECSGTPPPSSDFLQPTQAPTTAAPTTKAPTTQAPTTKAPTTQAPTTKAPTTQAPTTQAPTTQAPTTQAPTTEAPSTEAPTMKPTGAPSPPNDPPLTNGPTSAPTGSPTTLSPSKAPTMATSSPSMAPSIAPSTAPSAMPTATPTMTIAPSTAPSTAPTSAPTIPVPPPSSSPFNGNLTCSVWGDPHVHTFCNNEFSAVPGKDNNLTSIYKMGDKLEVVGELSIYLDENNKWTSYVEKAYIKAKNEKTQDASWMLRVRAEDCQPVAPKALRSGTDGPSNDMPYSFQYEAKFEDTQESITITFTCPGKGMNITIDKLDASAEAQSIGPYEWEQQQEGYDGSCLACTYVHYEGEPVPRYDTVRNAEFVQDGKETEPRSDDAVPADESSGVSSAATVLLAVGLVAIFF